MQLKTIMALFALLVLAALSVSDLKYGTQYLRAGAAFALNLIADALSVLTGRITLEEADYYCRECGACLTWPMIEILDWVSKNLYVLSDLIRPL
jgi:hypothetical protein